MTSRIALQTTPWPRPACLDALAAAPLYHQVVLENSLVRILDTRVPPGATVPLHTHQWPIVLHVLSWSDCVRRDACGNVDFDTRSETPACYSRPSPGVSPWRRIRLKTPAAMSFTSS